MKYLFGLLAGVLVACTVPPNTPIAEAVPEPVPADQVSVDPKPVKPKHSKPSPKVPALEVPKETAEPSADQTCSSIKTGDVKEDIHLKLDCLLSPQK